ncbi:hypothetical protein KBD11_01385, partial [Candidatus Saccharibacteria bacterium]|nr:hypothetical protein [Candidatus Saccharibacteria bacterium]
LSVTRAGGVGHNKRQKDLAAQTLKMLASYRQAEEFSHFGSELGPEAKHALSTGQRVFELMTQAPGDTFSLVAQQLMLDIVLNLEDGDILDINALKLNANDFATKVSDDNEYQKVRDLLYAQCVKVAQGTTQKSDKGSSDNSDGHSEKSVDHAEKPELERSEPPKTAEQADASAEPTADPASNASKDPGEPAHEAEKQEDLGAQDDIAETANDDATGKQSSGEVSDLADRDRSLPKITQKQDPDEADKVSMSHSGEETKPLKRSDATDTPSQSPELTDQQTEKKIDDMLYVEAESYKKSVDASTQKDTA